jgi:hypothetical protein
LLVDATGVCLPAIDLLRERGVDPVAVLFTGSATLTSQIGRSISIGKAYTESRLQMLLQSRRLHVPVTDQALALARELQDYQITVSERGHASFNARPGAHDDLVIALGLSVGSEPQAARAHSASYLHPEPSVEDWFTYRQRVRRLRGR